VDELLERDEFAWPAADAPIPAAPRTSSACTFPWYAMTVCADGTVTPCPQDFQAALPLGRVPDASLRDIWRSAPYAELRRRLATDIESLPLCRVCDRLCRPSFGGVPYSDLPGFLGDQLVGYNVLRRFFGTGQRH